MDTDGYIDRLGRCDLAAAREELAFDVLELVGSLGLRPRLARKRAVLDGRDVGPGSRSSSRRTGPSFDFRGSWRARSSMADSTGSARSLRSGMCRVSRCDASRSPLPAGSTSPRARTFRPTTAASDASAS